MSNTNLVTNMNADLLDGLHSHEQRRLGNAKDTLGTNAIAYGLNAEATGQNAVAIGPSSLASGNYAMAVGYYTKAIGQGAIAIMRAGQAIGEQSFVAGYNSVAYGNYSAVIGGNRSFAGLYSGDDNKKGVYLKLYTPEAITYNGSTVYGIWNRYNDASSVTFTYSGTSYTVNWPSGSPTYWRTLNIVKLDSDAIIPSSSSGFPWNRYLVITSSGAPTGNLLMQEATEITTGVYAIISSTLSSQAAYPDDKPMNNNQVRVGIWEKDSSTFGTDAIVGGQNAIASGNHSLALGMNSNAVSLYSVALGINSVAASSYGIALGAYSVAMGSYSFALNGYSTALAAYAVALGYASTARGTSAVAIGEHSYAKNDRSVVTAYYGESGITHQTVLGKFNAVTSTDALVVGWGTADNARANIMTLSTAGKLTLASGLDLSGDITFDASSASLNIRWKDSNNNTNVAVGLDSSGGLYFGSNQITRGKNTFISGTNLYLTFGSTSRQLVATSTYFRPATNGDISLGTSTLKWKEVYATTFYGALSGNASTATKLETARTLWGQSFDGSANVSGSLTGVTDITASGLATLPSIHAATSLSIPKVAPDTTASWYDSSHAYLWSDTEGNYAESASGGGGGGGETLTITKNGSSWLSYNGSTAVSLNLAIPTKVSDLNNDSGFLTASDLSGYLPLTAGSSKALTGDLYFDASSASKSIYWKDSSNNILNAFYLETSGKLNIGYNLLSNGKDTVIRGAALTLAFGSSASPYSIIATGTGVTLRPTANNTIALGTSSYKWKELYATTLYGNLALSYLTGADDLKAIEALTETSGFLKKTAANTWALTNDIEADSLKTSTESSPMFTFRQTPSVAVGDSLTLTKIKGKTLVWNQQLKALTAGNWSTESGVTITYNSGYATIAATTGNHGIYVSFPYLLNHKYYLAFTARSSSSVTIRQGAANTGVYNDGQVPSTNVWTRFTKIATCTTSAAAFYFYPVGTAATFDLKDILCIDLTAEGLDTLTAAEFEAIYPLGDYAYNSGSLLSLTASGLQTTGKNIWDEEWENGTFNTTTGANIVANSQVRAKNLIPVMPDTQYFFGRVGYTTNDFAWTLFYDSNKEIITGVTKESVGGRAKDGNSIQFASGATMTTPSNARYIRFYLTVTYPNSYQRDIIINKSDASFNGQYEPYKSNVARLDITTLKVKSPNIWDEEWEVGQYNTSGIKVNDSTAVLNIRCKNLIPVSGGETYYFKTPSQLRLCTYDAQGNFIEAVSGGANNNTKTLGSNVRFVAICTTNNATTTYGNNITINVSNPGHNGHYYPHGEFAPYADGMKDAGTAADELWQTGTRRKLKRVNLGDLTWTYSNSRFQATLDRLNGTLNCISTKYTVTSASTNAEDKTIYTGSYYGNNKIAIRDDAYTDAATFKTAVNGVYLDYEQANPEDFELVTPLDLMLPSDALGTQRLLPENGATPTTAPMVAEITYGANAGDIVGNIDTQLSVLNNRINTFGFDDLASHPTTLSGYGITDAVPSSRKVNNKALSSDITLTLDDLADGSTRKLANYLPLAGGTLTGNLLTTNIYPSSNLGGALGSTSLRFGNAWLGQELHLDDSTTVCGIYRGASTQAMRMLATNLRLGEGYAVSGGYTDIYGEQIRLYYSTSKTLGLTLDSSGTLIASGAMRIAGNIRPNSGSDTNSIGQANYPFTNIYGKTITASTSLLANGTLSVTGAATLSSTLSVTGAATLSSTLGVTGVATFNNDVLISASSAKLKFSGQDSGLYFDSGNSTYLPFFKVDTFHSFHIGNSSLGTDIVLLNDTYATYIESHQFYSTGEVYSEGNLYCEGNLTAESGAYIQTLLTIPTSAPSNPLSSYAYLWIDTNGNYAELPNS